MKALAFYFMEKIMSASSFSNISGNYKMSELNAALALADYERSKKELLEKKLIQYIKTLSQMKILSIFRLP